MTVGGEWGGTAWSQKHHEEHESSKVGLLISTCLSQLVFRLSFAVSLLILLCGLIGIMARALTTSCFKVCVCVCFYSLVNDPRQTT